MHTTSRKSWDLHGEHGWYVGPALQHYQCVTCYFPSSRSTQICDTITFLPQKVNFPEIKLVDFLKQAATDIITILTQPPSTTTPSLQAGDPICNALLDLATSLNQIKQLPTLRLTKNTTVSSPRVQTPNYAPPRVAKPSKTSPSPPVQTLLQHSKLPANIRFNNPPSHHYNLRPRPVIHHVYNQGKRETIDSACTGPNKDIWLRSLSNKWG